jgi:hypothetical protein
MHISIVTIEKGVLIDFIKGNLNIIATKAQEI